ncbi:MAG: hypothetical protein JRI25_28290, partial [Deltaproteobacteria bacterium]|nr:hypothetical protein [Deltaproteobacteria bacterium]
MLRKSLVLVLGLVVAGAAWAGPKVPKSAMGDVPQATLDQGQAMVEQIVVLESQIADAEREAASEKGGIKTLKLEIKAKEAEIDAEKAKRKVAKKVKDRDRQSMHEANITTLEAQVVEMQGEHRRASAYVDLIDARAGLLEAEKDIKTAEIQRLYADTVVETHPEVDINRFDLEATRAEIAFQEARIKVAEAQAKYVSKGGSLATAERVSEGGTSATGPVIIAPPEP